MKKEDVIKKIEQLNSSGFLAYADSYSFTEEEKNNAEIIYTLCTLCPERADIFSSYIGKELLANKVAVLKIIDLLGKYSFEVLPFVNKDTLSQLFSEKEWSISYLKSLGKDAYKVLMSLDEDTRNDRDIILTIIDQMQPSALEDWKYNISENIGKTILSNKDDVLKIIGKYGRSGHELFPFIDKEVLTQLYPNTQSWISYLNSLKKKAYRALDALDEDQRNNLDIILTVCKLSASESHFISQRIGEKLLANKDAVLKIISQLGDESGYLFPHLAQELLDDEQFRIDTYIIFEKNTSILEKHIPAISILKTNDVFLEKVLLRKKEIQLEETSGKNLSPELVKFNEGFDTKIITYSNLSNIPFFKKEVKTSFPPIENILKLSIVDKLNYLIENTDLLLDELNKDENQKIISKEFGIIKKIEAEQNRVPNKVDALIMLKSILKKENSTKIFGISSTDKENLIKQIDNKLLLIESADENKLKKN